MLVSEGDPAKVATILPDGRMSTERAVLHFTIGLLMEQGWTVRMATWPHGANSTAEEVEEAAAREIDEPEGALHLVVGFCRGSAAVRVVRDRHLPAVWISPWLRDDTIRAELSATLEPGLLVGGTGDVQWDPAFAQTTRLQVHSVDDADASLEIPGSVKNTLKSLTRTVRRIEDFVSGLEA